MKSRVAALRVEPATVLESIERLCELGGMRDGAVARRRRPSSRTTSPGTSPSRAPTPRPGSSRGPSGRCAPAGFRDLTCVQNKTVVTDAFKGEDLNQLRPDLSALRRARSSTTSSDEDMKWVALRAEGADARAADRIFPEGIHIPDYFFGKNIVHLPTVKCHIYTTTTGAMKNAFGGLLHTHRHYTHSWIHQTLVDLLAIQKEIHPGIFAVMDGTTAGNGPGPRTMFPVVKNVMLASADQVAIDAVAAKMMGFDPMTHRVHPRGARGRPRRGRPARHRDRRRRRRRRRSRGASTSATTWRASAATSSGSRR